MRRLVASSACCLFRDAVPFGMDCLGVGLRLSVERL